MADQSKMVHLSFRIRGVLSLLVLSFLFFCLWDKISGDFAAGHIGRMTGRGLLLAAISILVAARLPHAVAWGQRLPLRQGGLLIFFLFIIYFPLVKHYSVLSEGVPGVWQKIEEKHGGTESISIRDILKMYPAKYEKYLGKQSILSKVFVYLNGVVKVYLLHVSPSTKVALGSDGFFFEGYGARRVEKGVVERFDNIADYMGQTPFTARELKQWQRTLEERSYWLERQGIKYVFVLAPTKGFVYPEYLPQSIGKRKGYTRYEQLSEYLEKNSSVNFVDLLPVLLEAKKNRDYPMLFYKTDFHWNYYGSLVAYGEVVEKINQFYPQYDLKPFSIDDFDINVNTSWAHHRFMELISLPPVLHKSDHYLTMKPRGSTAYDGVVDFPEEGINDVEISKKKISDGAGHWMNIRLIENKQPGLPFSSILLLGDSFFEKCVYYFTAHSKRVLNHRTIVNFPVKIFRYEKPDIVIQEILNMFILRKPPENPAVVKEPWLEMKFLGENGRIVKTDILQETQGGDKNSVQQYRMQAGYRPEDEVETMKVLRLTFNSSVEQRVKIVIGSQGEGDNKLMKKSFAAGHNTVFLESGNSNNFQVKLVPLGKERGTINLVKTELKLIGEY